LLATIISSLREIVFVGVFDFDTYADAKTVGDTLKNAVFFGCTAMRFDKPFTHLAVSALLRRCMPADQWRRAEGEAKFSDAR
jgi:hypothetical protein